VGEVGERPAVEPGARQLEEDMAVKWISVFQ